jgi:hypothetical protein
MSLRDKLKPNSKKPGLGKVVPCPRCGRDAEHYSANFIMCPSCDKPLAKRVDEALEASVLLDLELDEPTNPGGWTSAPAYTVPIIPAHFRWYHCVRCSTQTKCDPNDVAAGKRCGCGASLYLKASP